MPLYDYTCTQCGRTHEVRHGFDETYDRACEACGAPLKRVFNAAPVLFKGSGFYVTDSRGPAAGAKEPKAVEKPKEGSSESKSERSSESKSETPSTKESGTTAKPSEPAA